MILSMVHDPVELATFAKPKGGNKAYSYHTMMILYVFNYITTTYNYVYFSFQNQTRDPCIPVQLYSGVY